MMRRPENIAGILLAAGESKRYGEQNKLLLKLKNMSVIQQSLKAMLDSSLAPIYLVLGYQSHQIRAAIGELTSNPKLEIIINENWKDGQSTSKRAALEVLPENCEAALFHLGDMPLITTQLINRVIEGYCESDQITFPIQNRTKGHPIIWPKRYWAELSSIPAQESGMALVKKHWSSTTQIPLNSNEIQTQWDVDTQESYQKVLDLIGEKS